MTNFRQSIFYWHSPVIWLKMTLNSLAPFEVSNQISEPWCGRLIPPSAMMVLNFILNFRKWTRDVRFFSVWTRHVKFYRNIYSGYAFFILRNSEFWAFYDPILSHSWLKNIIYLEYNYVGLNILFPRYGYSSDQRFMINFGPAGDNFKRFPKVTQNQYFPTLYFEIY